MIYIGIHSTNNLDDGYLGSGTVIKNKIAKHGRSAMHKEIIAFYPDRETALLMESVYVDEIVLNDPLTMNIRIGGKGNTVAQYQKMSEDARAKKSERLKAQWEDPVYKAAMRQMSADQWINPTDAMKSKLEKMRQARIGSKHTDETRKIISERNHSPSAWILKWGGKFHFVRDNICDYIDNALPFRYGTAFKAINKHPEYKNKDIPIHGIKETGSTAGFEVCRFPERMMSMGVDKVIQSLVDAQCLFGTTAELNQLKQLM